MVRSQSDEPEDPNRVYSNQNESTYEYEAPEDAWRAYTYNSACVKGQGNRSYTNELIDLTKQNPVDLFVMKNKQTVEKIRNREYGKVRKAYINTLESFTFQTKNYLKSAQEDAKRLLKRLEDVEDDLSASDLNKINGDGRYREMKAAIERFADEKDLDAAAERSADVLLAVEEFSKGRKGFASDVEKRFMRYAVRAIGHCVPDAANNPSVKPLMNRINEVRSHRFMEQLQLPPQVRPSAANRHRFTTVNEKTAVTVGPLKNAGNMFEFYEEEDPADERTTQQKLVQQKIAQQKQMQEKQKQKIAQQNNLFKAAEELMNQEPVDQDEQKKAADDIYKFMYDEEPKDDLNVNDVPQIGAQPENVAPDLSEWVEKKEIIEPVMGNLEFMENLSDNYLKNDLTEESMAKQFATCIAIDAYKRIPEAPADHLYDKTAIKKEVETRQDDPAVKEMAHTFKTNKAMRDELKKAMTASVNAAAENKGSGKFDSYMKAVHGLYQGFTKAFADQKPEEAPFRRSMDKVQPAKAPANVQNDDPERDSSLSSNVGNERYTQVEDDMIGLQK